MSGAPDGDAAAGVAATRRAGIARLVALVRGHWVAGAAIGLKLLSAFATFVVISLVARSAGPAVTGDYAMAVATSVLVSLISALGLEMVLTRTIGGDLREGKLGAAWAVLMRVTRIVGPVSLAAAAVLFVLAQWAPRIGATIAPMQVIALSVATFPLMRLAVVALRSAGSILWSQWFDGAHSFAILAGVAFMILRGIPIDALIMAWFYTGAVTISLVWSWAILLWRTRDWPRGEASTDPMLSASWRFLAAGVCQTSTQWTVLAIMGAMLGAGPVGAYRVANQIVTIIALMLTTIEAFVSPQLAGDFRVGDVRGAWARHRRATWMMSVVAMPAILVCLFAPSWMLGTLFGPEFVIAASALAILACGQAVNVFTGPIGGIMVMAGHERLALKLAVGGLLIVGVLTAPLIGGMGLAGGALALALALAFRNLSAFVLMKRWLRT